MHCIIGIKMFESLIFIDEAIMANTEPPILRIPSLYIDDFFYNTIIIIVEILFTNT